MQKIWIFPLFMLLSATASAAFNSFDQNVVFPEKTKIRSFLKSSSYVNESDLNHLKIGLNQAQTRLLMSNTQLISSLSTDRTWFYIFKFHELDKPDLVCQYQIQFDDQLKVSGSYFNRPACVKHLQPLPAEPEAKTEVSAIVTPPSGS